MLRMPEFDVVAPDSVAGVVDALQSPGARLIAGGTDMLPNMKHRLYPVKRLVSLSRVQGLDQISLDESRQELRVGAAATLADVSENEILRSRFPSLAHAAGIVASPSIRNTATIGGNINLDTRCRYVNQTAFWRSAIGGCLKSEGTVCHVVPGGRNCVAAMSSDTAPVLTTLDARVVLVGSDGEREVAICDYYNSNGVSHINKQPDEVMTNLIVPLARGPRRSTYGKWTVRSSIDFPLVSVALRFDLEEDTVHSRICQSRVCVGVLNAVPRVVAGTDVLVGNKLSDRATESALCELLHKRCKPLGNVPYEAPYRRKMIPVYARRALRALIAKG